MGKITRIVTEKHKDNTSKFIDRVVSEVASVPLYQIPASLAKFPQTWPFPRGDIYNWIPVLNRFDDILEKFIKLYGLDQGPQTKSFGLKLLIKNGDIEASEDFISAKHLAGWESSTFREGDCGLVVQIINFTRLLLENCGNRSLYASSEHLNKLLNTTSLTLLEATLRLTHRLAQRYLASRLRQSPTHHVPTVSQSLLSSHYMISLESIEQLAQPFPKSLSETKRVSDTAVKQSEKGPIVTPSYASDLLQLLRDPKLNYVDFGKTYGEVWLNYLDPASVASETPDSPTKHRPSPLSNNDIKQDEVSPNQIENDTQMTSVKSESSTTPSLKLLEIGEDVIVNSSTEALTDKFLSEVPESFRYELFTKIRMSKALSSSHTLREQAISVRLLAIANLAHIYPEQVLQSKIFQHELEQPRRLQLPYQLCDLIHVPSDEPASVSKKLQIYALIVLEAFTNHKTKHSDICTALSVNANHGILTWTVRRAVSELSSEAKETLVDIEWREVLFALLHMLPKSNSRISENFVQAGLMDILTEALTYQTDRAERNHPRVLNFLDVFLYNTRDAMNALVNAKGLDIMSSLLATEVEKALKSISTGKGFPEDFRTHGTDFIIPFEQQQTLRGLLKFIKNRIQHGVGQFDRLLRNLIESSELLNGLGIIIRNPKDFGSNVWSAAVEMFSNFINMEPTSYGAMAEAGLPQTFLETITQRSVDVSAQTQSENGMPVETKSSTSTTQQEQSTNGNTATSLTQGILPSIEVIAAIPHAFSAICLNEAGMKQFEESVALDIFFSLFQSPGHLKILAAASIQDLESIGHSFDELTRHHPRLKPNIIQGVYRMTAFASKILFQRSQIYQNIVKSPISENEIHGLDSSVSQSEMAYGLMGNSNSNVSLDRSPALGSGSEDVEMQNVGESQPSDTSNSNRQPLSQPHRLSPEKRLAYEINKDCVMVIEAFLSGFFQNHSLCGPFASETNGVEALVDMITSPAMPHEFTSQPYQRLIKVFGIFIEHKPHLVLPLLLDRAMEATEYLETFLNFEANDCFFAMFLKPPPPGGHLTDNQKNFKGKGGMTFKMLTVVESICRVLERSFGQPLHRNITSPFFNVNLTDKWVKLIDIWGRVQCKCIWEAVLIESEFPAVSKKPGSAHTGLWTSPNSFGRVGLSTPDVSTTENDSNTPANQSQQQASTATASNQSSQSSLDVTFEKAAIMIWTRMNSIPSVITQFFATLGKIILTRRLPSDLYSKQNIIRIADHIGATFSKLLISPSPDANLNLLTSYKAISLKFLMATIWDQRPERDGSRSNAQILTLILQAFKANQGFERLSEVANFLQHQCETMEIKSDAENNGEKVWRCSKPAATQGLFILLSLLTNLTSHKSFQESQQTIHLSSRSPDRDKPEIFSAPHVFVEIKLLALNIVMPLWNSDCIEKIKPIVGKSCKILQHVLDNSGESGATRTLKTEPFHGQQKHERWKLRNEDAVGTLTARGFDKKLAMEALYRCCSHVASAQEYCATYKRNEKRPRNPPPPEDIEPEPEIQIESHDDNEVNSEAQQDSSISSTANESSNRDEAMPDATENGELHGEAGLLMSIINQQFQESSAQLRPATSDTPTVAERPVSPNDQDDTSKPNVREEPPLVDLETQRLTIREDLMSRSLVVLSAWPQNAFEISDLIIAGIQKSPEPAQMREEVTITLIQSLISLQSGDDMKKQCTEAAAQAHLLGILLQNKDIFEAAQEQLQGDFSSLLTFIKAIPGSDSSKPSSELISSILLILERTLSEDAQPHQIQWSTEAPEQPSTDKLASLKPSLISQEDKEALFNRVLDLLPQIGKESKLGVSVIRILVSLTRNRSIASQLGQRRNMQRLFVMVKQLSTVSEPQLHPCLMLVLRQVIEDEEIIRQIFRSGIKDLMEKSTVSQASRGLDITTYTRQLSHLILRAPQTFVEMTNEMLVLNAPHSPYTLSLKKDLLSEKVVKTDHTKESSDDTVRPSAEAEPEIEKAKSTELKAPVVENPDGVIHFLLSELLAYKDVTDKEPQLDLKPKPDQSSEATPASEANTSDESPSNASKTSQSATQPLNASDYPIHIYRCILLRCLTELLQSYNRTKVEFINFSRKADPQAMTPSKPRSGVLNYLLNVLIPKDTIKHASDDKQRMTDISSDCAIRCVVSLCARTSEKGDPKLRENSLILEEEETDLLFVRRFVLEHALKVYKDVGSSTESQDVKYSKLLCIADLFNRMLAGQPSEQPSRFRTPDITEDNLVPSQKQLAKIMFEKNFIAALTTSVSDVDLSFPGVGRAVKYILRPLKLLTHSAIELSQSSDISIPTGQTDEDEISSASSVSEMEEDREETPDLFRNSTLGMFEPGREGVSDSEETGEDEEDDDEDEDEDELYGQAYADDMDYEEEIVAEEDEMVSDEDGVHHMEDVGDVEGLPADDVGIIQYTYEVDPDADPEDMEDLDDDEDDTSGDSDEDDGSEDDEDHDVDLDMEEIVEDDNNSMEDDPIARHLEDMDDGLDDTDQGAPTISYLGNPDHDSFTLADDSHPIGAPHGEAGMQHYLSALGHDPTDGDILGADDEDEDVEEETEEDIMDEEDDYEEDDLAFEEPEFDDETEDSPFHEIPHPRRHRNLIPPPWVEMPDGRTMHQIRSGRSSNQRMNDDGMNPLLNREATRHTGSSITGRSENRRTTHFDQLPTGLRHEFAQFIREGHQLGYLSHMLGEFGGTPQHFPMHLHGITRTGPLTLSVDIGEGSNHHHHHHHHSHQFGMPRDLLANEVFGLSRAFRQISNASRTDAPFTNLLFEPFGTEQRWQEASRLLFGANTSVLESSHRIVNTILRLLYPAALEQEKIRAAENRKKEEEARRQAEKEAKERKEKEEKEAREAEERAAAEAAAAEAESARIAAEQSSSSEDQSAQSTDAVTGDAMEGIEQSQPSESVQDSAQEISDEQPQSDRPRMTINIRGRELDITDLGIDSTYLDALPEEMREEVIMQQFAEQRSQAVASGEPPSTISSEFLDALPPELRREILQQEASDRRRAEREQARRQRQNEGGTAQADEMDNASFLATLDPILRQTVLQDTEEDVLAEMGPEYIAEARALGNRGHRRALDPTSILSSLGMPQRLSSSRRGEESHEQDENKPPRRPIVQMLDKSGVATLLKLMFVPSAGHSRSTLNGILRNVSGNRQTRGEVINGILAILQDGSADIGAVEKCFAQLSLRAKQNNPSKPQQATKKAPTTPSLTNDASPSTVIGQCLNSLTFLTQSLTHIPQFFLTEHEVSGSKTKSSRKGKGRDVKVTKYPLVTLLSLLDRETVVNSVTVMEQLANLLANMTHPLSQLPKPGTNDSKDKKPETQATAENTEMPSVPQTTPGTLLSTDVPMSQTNSEDHAVDAANSNSNVTSGTTNEKKESVKKSKVLTAPDILPENLRLVANILTARDCSSKTFRDTLTIITNLSAIPNAKEVFCVELIDQARKLGSSIFSSLEHLVKALQDVKSEMQAQSIALTNFSPNGSDQVKLSRILTALDYLFESASGSTGQTKDALSEFYEDSTFLSLWQELSKALSATQRSGTYFFNVATILLPLIEALMVVCKRISFKDASGKAVQLETDEAPDSKMLRLFFSFTNRHKKILNDLVRQNPKLMSGSFSVLVKNSGVLEFDNKRNYFTRRLHHRTSEERSIIHPSLQLNLRREWVFLDSYKGLHFKKPDEIKYGKINVRFNGEEGVDAGGVTREWFQVLARQMFNPDYALFNPVASDRTTFHPNSLSGINQEHLRFFKFIGRIIGKALYENRVLDCHFSRAVYKRILGKAVSMKDMETLDLDYSKNMEWMLNNDITDIITETFSITQDKFGVEEIIDLIPNGRNIPVTEENKAEYVRLVIEYRLTGSVKEQLESFLEGFHDIVPAELISIFDEGELELLISGMPEVDVDDWKNNTEYHQYTVSSTQIQWFWRAVRSFDKEERARLLQFVTGTGKVPLNGFKELEGMNGVTRFSIHKDYGDKDRLPSSHTCFNQLDLPEYESYEQLRKLLYTAMTTGNEYFGFA